MDSSLRDLASRALQEGLSAIDAGGRTILADLFVKEVKKATFEPVDDDAQALQDFLQHTMAEFPGGLDQLVVWDVRPMLRRNAEALSGEDPPVASLILFATWLEHHLNAVLKVRTVWAGPGDAEATGVIKKTSVLERIEWCVSRLGLPRMDDARLTEIASILEERHELVHFKWIGQATTTIEKRQSEISRMVKEAPELLDYLIAYERRSLSSVAMARAAVLFGVEPSVQLNSRDDG